MNSDLVTTLRGNRAHLLWCEVGALLHDLGKLSSFFIDAKAEGSRWDPGHCRIVGSSTDTWQASLNAPNVAEAHRDQVEALAAQDPLSREDRRGVLDVSWQIGGQVGNDIRDALAQNIQNNWLPAELQTKLRETALDDPFDASTACSLADIIAEHHPRRGTSPVPLVQYLIACDHRDSADDKGPDGLLSPQPLNSCMRSNVFGTEKPIDLRAVDNKARELHQFLTDWLSSSTAGVEFSNDTRLEFLSAYRDATQLTLGETRRPANDVTLWDHTYSVASLYKTMMAAQLTVGEDAFRRAYETNYEKVVAPLPQEGDGTESADDEYPGVPGPFVTWRIFGVAWNGTSMIAHSTKIADSQARVEAIEAWKKHVREHLEWEVPVGNCIYEDLNGVYFTFPSLTTLVPGNPAALDVERAAAANLASSLLNVNELDDEPLRLFLMEAHPILSLSEPTTSMALLAHELRRNRNLTSAPVVPTVLVLRSRDNDEQAIEQQVPVEFARPTPQAPRDADAVGTDRCPVCSVRAKARTSELCPDCAARRKGRRDAWVRSLSDEARPDTIWVEEVADERNLCALVCIRADLHHWLTGDQLSRQLMGTNRADAWEHARQAVGACQSGWPDHIATMTGFNQIRRQPPQTIERYYRDRWRYRQDVSNPAAVFGDADALACAVLQKAPCPSRLRRVWRDLKDFMDEADAAIRARVGSWSRLLVMPDSDAGCLLFGEEKEYSISIRDDDELGAKYRGGWYADASGRLENGCLRSCASRAGLPARTIRQAAELGVVYARVEDPDDAALVIDDELCEVRTEDYAPLIEVTHTPVELQVVIPAISVCGVLQCLHELVQEHFGLAHGKLPIHMGVLFFKHRYPLYTVLSAAAGLFDPYACAESEKWTISRTEVDRILLRPPGGLPQDWTFPSQNPCADCYTMFTAEGAVGSNGPSAFASGGAKHRLLSGVGGATFPPPLQQGDRIHTMPSYLDFAYLRGLTDTAGLRYVREADGCVRRPFPDEPAGLLLFSHRPYHRETIPRLLEAVDSIQQLKGRIHDVANLAVRKSAQWGLMPNIAAEAPNAQDLREAVIHLVHVALDQIPAEGNEARREAIRRLSELPVETVLDAFELWKAAVRNSEEGATQHVLDEPEEVPAPSA